MDFLSRLFHALTELHPLHPMLVHFPIGLTGAGTLFILLAVWKRDAVLEQAAFFNNSLAVLGTLAAGLAGIFDNERNYNGEAPNALVKIILATILLTVTSLSAYIRWRNPSLFYSKARFFYIAAYPISFALALTLAFLGGVILYGF